jgi:hypothetical protein
MEIASDADAFRTSPPVFAKKTVIPMSATITAMKQIV